jgi:hypothetical protein
VALTTISWLIGSASIQAAILGSSSMVAACGFAAPGYWWLLAKLFQSWHNASTFAANAESTGSCLTAGVVAVELGDGDEVVVGGEGVREGGPAESPALVPELAEQPATPKR